MPIMKFSTDEEVVMLANDSRYGLGCAVFSGSQRRAKEIASQIHCGVAAINDFASSYMCQVMLHFRRLRHRKGSTNLNSHQYYFSSFCSKNYIRV